MVDGVQLVFSVAAIVVRALHSGWGCGVARSAILIHFLSAVVVDKGYRLP